MTGVQTCALPIYSKPNTPQIHTFDQFSDARAWLDQTARSGDVVLVENDLPDLYERTFKT